MSDGFRIRTAELLLVWGTPPEGEPLPELPRLREQTAYPVFLRSETGEPVALEHRDPPLLGGLRVGDGGRVVYGTVNFGSQIGRSSFRVRVGERVVLRFGVEVVPTKLDYETDYLRIAADTQDLLLALVLEYLRSTFQLGAPAPAPESTRLEWLLLLRHAADELERALDHVARAPRWGMLREAHPTRAERVRRADAALHRALLRGRGAGGVWTTDGGASVRQRLPEGRARPTLDTPEHRWIAAQLGRIRRRLARAAAEQRRGGPSPRRERIVEEIRALEGRISRLAALPPFAMATGDPPPGWSSLQLGAAPGYREAHRACRILALGLRLRGGPVRLAVRDLHLLYEQWCFLALVRLVGEVAGSPPPAGQLLAAEEQGLRVALRRGWEHPVRFALPDGRRADLVYNPRFAGHSLLVPQRPDILLELHTPGEPSKRWVLDAKYRIDDTAAYRRRFGVPGPPEDALNGLHRYRDALGVEQAIALFPHREAEPGEFRASRLWRSVGRIGIGACPFLPGETGYAAEWLRGLLRE